MLLFILCGPPACGKSTFVEQFTKGMEPSQYVVISSDNLIEGIAKAHGKTYDECWNDHKDWAMKHVLKQVQNAVEHECPIIIWDQTNLTRKKRAERRAMCPGYLCITVGFQVPCEEELKRRLASRPGKTIPDHVIKSMIESYEFPVAELEYKAIIGDEITKY